MKADRQSFYADVAKGLAASAKLYHVNAVVHVEDADDIWFWQQLLSKYSPGRYKFLRATTNEKGHVTSGCTQCLKYKDFLSQKFFICIDSDLRYLSCEDLRAEKGILQTYTYSWENHCTFAAKLQKDFNERTGGKIPFDFCLFLEKYSHIVYRPFLLMLFQERVNHTGFRRGDFHRCIALQYQKGDENGNGATFLKRMEENLTKADDIAGQCGFDFNAERERYAALGLHETNAYLYVRGHDLYNSLVSIGRKLCEGTGIDFEQNIMKSVLAFDQYDEITKIKTDIVKLQTPSHK